MDFKPVPSKNLLDFDEEDKHKVHISFLEPFEGFGEGLFIMTDVKKMTSKNDFLNLPLKDRNCKVESYEDCKTRKLLEECRCVPWDVPGYEVKTFQQDQTGLMAWIGPRVDQGSKRSRGRPIGSQGVKG